MEDLDNFDSLLAGSEQEEDLSKIQVMVRTATDPDNCKPRVRVDWFGFPTYLTPTEARNRALALFWAVGNARVEVGFINTMTKGEGRTVGFTPPKKPEVPKSTDKAIEFVKLLRMKAPLPEGVDVFFRYDSIDKSFSARLILDWHYAQSAQDLAIAATDPTKPNPAAAEALRFGSISLDDATNYALWLLEAAEAVISDAVIDHVFVHEMEIFTGPGELEAVLERFRLFRGQSKLSDSFERQLNPQSAPKIDILASNDDR